MRPDASDAGIALPVMDFQKVNEKEHLVASKISTDYYLEQLAELAKNRGQCERATPRASVLDCGG